MKQNKVGIEKSVTKLYRRAIRKKHIEYNQQILIQYTVSTFLYSTIHVITIIVLSLLNVDINIIILVFISDKLILMFQEEKKEKIFQPHI